MKKSLTFKKERSRINSVSIKFAIKQFAMQRKEAAIDEKRTGGAEFDWFGYDWLRSQDIG